MSASPTHAQLRRDRPLCHRILFLTCLLTLGFSGVVWRLYDLHVKQAPQLAAEAAKKYRQNVRLVAQRGSIKDFQGKFLAYDEEVFELQTDRVHLHEVRSVVPCLALALGMPEKQVVRTMTNEQILAAYHDHVARVLSAKLGEPVEEVRVKIGSKRPIEVLKQQMNEDLAAEWRSLLGEKFVKGVYVKPSVRRCYPTEDRLALVIGGLKDGLGDRGIEKVCENVLCGTDGYVEIERDKYGRELPLYRGEMKDPVHGRDIHLTIDMQLQDSIDAILEQADLTYKPNKIMAVVTEVATGSILAMSFRPGHKRGAPTETNWKNLAIAEPYEPGSTFKIVTFTAALDQKKITPDERFDCALGAYTDPQRKVALHDVSHLGVVPAREVFAKSSNIGTYKIFKRVGQEDFLDYVKRFGFGSRTNVDLTGESRGYINTGRWSNSTYSRFPIGYEVNVTPLQMAMAFGAIANGGKLMKPRVVDRIVGEGGRLEETVPPQVISQVCSSKTAATMRELLENVVEEGTGHLASLEDIRVAGKTGTSLRYDPDYVWHDDRGHVHKGGYPKNQWITSFAGFAPAGAPKIAVVVVLDNPHAKDPADIGGGKVAAPIFAEIVGETLQMLSVRPQRSLAMKGDAQ